MLTSLYTGTAGIKANSNALGTVGNNIASRTPVMVKCRIGFPSSGGLMLIKCLHRPPGGLKSAVGGAYGCFDVLG